MKAIWFALLCLLPLMALADVYEWVDQNGRTIYSDTPHPGAKRIPLPDFAPVPPPPSLEGTFPESAPTAQAPAISALRIVRPAEGETIHDNSGDVTVEWAVDPADVPPPPGFRLSVDGTPLPDLQAGRSYTFHGMDRGEHTVQVTAVGQNGQALAASATVTFYLWEASRLFRQRLK